MIMTKNTVLIKQKGIDPLYKIWHRHNESFMLLYVCSGKGSLVLRDHICPLEGGCLYYVGNRVMHYTFPQKPEEYVRSKLLYATSLLDADPENSRFFASRQIVCAKIPPCMQPEVEAIFEETSLADKSIRNSALIISALKLLTYLRRFEAESLGISDSPVSKAVQYINSHISDSLSLDSICKSIHISKYHLCHSFKKDLGVSVMDYVLRTRLEAATELIVTGPNFSMSEISEKCGFSSFSYFCQAFKKATGLSATQYKKKYG